MGQVGQPPAIRRVGGMQVQPKSEAVKIPLQIIVTGIALIKREAGQKLPLSRTLEPGRDGPNPDLRAFRVKIPTEPLEVGAEM
jgi:hypothetical protein